MTLEQAQKSTTKHTILTTTALLIFFTLLLFIEETRGDFANGILFFLAGVLNPIVLIFLIILYSLVYFLSRVATKEIILKNKKPWQLSLAIAVLISVVTDIYFNVWAVVKMGNSRSYIRIANFVEPALRLFFLTVFLNFIIWIWATSRTKKLRIDSFEIDDISSIK